MSKAQEGNAAEAVAKATGEPPMGSERVVPPVTEDDSVIVVRDNAVLTALDSILTADEEEDDPALHAVAFLTHPRIAMSKRMEGLVKRILKLVDYSREDYLEKVLEGRSSPEAYDWENFQEFAADVIGDFEYQVISNRITDMKERKARYA